MNNVFDQYEVWFLSLIHIYHGMSKLYEVSCEELDFLNDCAKEYGVTGSRAVSYTHLDVYKRQGMWKHNVKMEYSASSI